MTRVSGRANKNNEGQRRPEDLAIPGGAVALGVMKFRYKTNDTCSTEITFDLTGDRVTNIVFSGGCSGNLKAIPLLIDGWTADDIIQKCAGITCGRRKTSCADQLAAAIRKAREEAPGGE
mgnify:CR=1 FL=1